MRTHFPRRTSDSEWTAGCHTRRRTSCLSCFRSRTYCNASPYTKTQVTGSPCSTPPYGSAAGCVKANRRAGFDSVHARNRRRVMWSPLRQCCTPAWRPASGCRSPSYPAPPTPPRRTRLLPGFSRGGLDNHPPAVVVETSPGNFQVWVNHGRVPSDHTFSTQAAKELARRFGGDSSSADWRHFGRLAGFTNQKPKRRLRNGLQPFVRLHECEGRLYGAAREFLRGSEIARREGQC